MDGIGPDIPKFTKEKKKKYNQIQTTNGNLIAVLAHFVSIMCVSVFLQRPNKTGRMEFFVCSHQRLGWTAKKPTDSTQSRSKHTHVNNNKEI